MLSFQHLYPAPVGSNCKQAITAKPWDEAYLIQINYLKNVRGTEFTHAINRLKTEQFEDQVMVKFGHISRGFRSHTAKM